jgi:formylglycine-generating enzyme required for sulfatase activity
MPAGFDDPQRPRVWVNYYEAEAYANWRAGSLPSEIEWEYAARGPASSIYPWGNDWHPGYANTVEAGLGTPAKVGSFAENKSWCGAYDMAGNVWEFTRDWAELFPQRQHEKLKRYHPGNEDSIVVKGGSWGGPKSSARCAKRGYDFTEGGKLHKSTAKGMRIVSFE